MKRALVGNGGHAKEVEFIIGEKFLKFVSDEFYTGEEFTEKLSNFNPRDYELMIAVGNSQDRYKIFKSLPENTNFFTFVHNTSIIKGNTKIGRGTFIGPFCTITTNVSLGDHLLLNRYNQISHDCKIGDFFSMMPGSILSGDVSVGDRVYIGTNACVREKINICDDVVIGLNSGVLGDIDVAGVYAGTPAIKMK
jgi:sugar O-acyltransferase (sialic acid O-acetyltransferase NeuD family)